MPTINSTLFDGLLSTPLVLPAPVAGALAAGLTGAALVDLLDEVRATPHTEAFARALEAGAILLWVRVPGEAEARSAEAIMDRHGGSDIHRHVR